MSKFFVFVILHLLVRVNIQISGQIHDKIDAQNNIIGNDELQDNNGYIYLITGGYRETTHILAKYVVSIRYLRLKRKKFGENHICGGSIIAESLVLTAAHCVYIPKRGPMANTDLEVVAGTPQRLRQTVKSQVRGVEELVVHRKYVSFSHRFDIGLIKLDKPFKLSKDYVTIIPLPDNNVKAGELCTVLGWGRMYENGPSPNEILYCNISILSHIECRRRLAVFSPGNICAADKKDMEKGACKGDSGSPLICNGVVTGLVSYGFGCDSKTPDVYTDVYFFRGWISENKAHSFTISRALIRFVYTLCTYYYYNYI